MILLQAALTVGFALGSFGAWSPSGSRRVRMLHLWAPLLGIGLLAFLLWLGWDAKLSLSVTIPGIALAILIAGWAQNMVWPVYGTYKFIFPLCLVALLTPLWLDAPQEGPAGLSAVFWLHIALAAVAYTLVVHAFILMLVRGFEMENLPEDLEEEGKVPLLTVERLAMGNIYAGLAVLTLTLASGLYVAAHDQGEIIKMTHKNIFAFLTWIELVAFIAGHLIWGWRGKTAVAGMGVGLVLLLLSYFGTAFVLEVIFQR